VHSLGFPELPAFRVKEAFLDGAGSDKSPRMVTPWLLGAAFEVRSKDRLIEDPTGEEKHEREECFDLVDDKGFIVRIVLISMNNANDQIKG